MPGGDVKRQLFATSPNRVAHAVITAIWRIERACRPEQFRRGIELFHRFRLLVLWRLREDIFFTNA